MIMDLETNLVTNYTNEKSAGSLADLLVKAVVDLEKINNETTSADFRALVRGVQLTLVALSSSIGECHGAVPYSPMHPVRLLDGTLQWCCNHEPQHCS